MNRRRFFYCAGSVAALTTAAGCLGDDDSGDGPDADDETRTTAENETDERRVAPDLPEIEDPPDAVYVPTHREAMQMLEPVEAGAYALAPMLSYPHPFWLVDGRETERVDPDGSPAVHLMFTLWDADTGLVLPVESGAQIRVERDGQEVGSPRSPWAMISQEMGFHFGDNVPLDEDGTYTVEVTLPPIGVRKTGALEGRFAETETATFEFTYDEDFRRAVIGGIEYLDEDLWGERGALEPMEHGQGGGGDEGDDHEHDDSNAHDEGDGEDTGHEGEDGHDADGHEEGGGNGQHEDHGDGHVPYSSLPPAEDYPETLLGDPETGDATLVTTLLESDTRLTDGSHPYLLVSPRTPYNRVPLADMAISATIGRDGEELATVDLEQTLDDEYDLHYGAELVDVQPETGDTVTLTVESPPQVSRHRGYETAFLEMPPVEVEVDMEVPE
ncbi:DUF7350 domain-containing protein [Halomontanus rarus]|uniref:DUF7350 domain-containing protein n=1 Tax=Halomontanus rarus TaxID=3034020 RepID=UPI001A99143E